MTGIGFFHHDHLGCIEDAMQKAQAICDQRKVKFTPVRRRVLELLLQDHRAMGAYEILEKLAAEGLGSQPPSVYRALEFLTRHGLAHRIERLNAYSACTVSDTDHIPVFLICRECRSVAESKTAQEQKSLESAATDSGFVIERVTIEAEGLCPSCVPGGAVS